MSDYLQLVNGRWRVRIVVPPALRSVIGKSALVKGLGTGNRPKASRLAVRHLAEFRGILAEAAAKVEHYCGVYDHVFKGIEYHDNVKPRRHYNSSDLASASQEWYTPPKVFKALDVNFDMDVASPGAKIVPWIPAERHLTPVDDGLNTPWGGFVWLNPPYGLRNGMQAWIDKFIAHRNGIILLPGYTYTQWFQDFIVETDCILFPLFKLNFINPDGPVQRGNSTLPNCLAAIGELGTAALHRAAVNGFGRLLVSGRSPRNLRVQYRPASAINLLMMAKYRRHGGI